MARGKNKVKPSTSRRRQSQSITKLDCSLDDYIDRNKLIKSGPKRLLRKLLLLRDQDSNEVKTTVTGLSLFLSVNVKTIRAWLKSLSDAGFILYEGEIWDPHCNYPKKKFCFPAAFPGFDAAPELSCETRELKPNSIIHQSANQQEHFEPGSV